ncbi:hypothetical protein AMTRI_Chr03g50200 [Amborella trichopoda]
MDLGGPDADIERGAMPISVGFGPIHQSPPKPAKPTHCEARREPAPPHVSPNPRLKRRNSHYGECLKNHAAAIGGHALDGCCEFMPSGEEGSIESLKCAACNCHRNFHRKDSEENSIPQSCLYCYHRSPKAVKSNNHFLPLPSSPQGVIPGPPFSMVAFGPNDSSSEDLHNQVIRPMCVVSKQSNGNKGSDHKRFRTKFTQEQKERMLGFAERVGWRIQKQDEGAVQRFCDEVGVKRHVLKVWMHNNKNTLGKKSSS